MEQQRKLKGEGVKNSSQVLCPAVPEVCPDQDRERKGAKQSPVLLSSTKWAENFLNTHRNEGKITMGLCQCWAGLNLVQNHQKRKPGHSENRGV